MWHGEDGREKRSGRKNKTCELRKRKRLRNNYVCGMLMTEERTETERRKREKKEKQSKREREKKKRKRTETERNCNRKNKEKNKGCNETKQSICSCDW